MKDKKPIYFVLVISLILVSLILLLIWRIKVLRRRYQQKRAGVNEYIHKKPGAQTAEARMKNAYGVTVNVDAYKYIVIRHIMKKHPGFYELVIHKPSTDVIDNWSFNSPVVYEKFLHTKAEGMTIAPILQNFVNAILDQEKFDEDFNLDLLKKNEVTRRLWEKFKGKEDSSEGKERFYEVWTDEKERLLKMFK